MDATLAPVPIETATVERTHEVGRPIVSLGLVEAWRMVRHPVFLLFVGLSAFFSTMLHVELSTETWGWYQQLTGMPLVVFATGMPIVGVLAATRSRHDDTDELYDAQPITSRQRRAGQVVAFGVIAGATAAFVAVLWVATRAWEGLPVGFNDRVTRHTEYGRHFPTADVAPSLSELAQGPAAVFVCGLVGLCLGRWVPTRWTIAVLVPAVFMTMILVGWGLDGDLRWFHPFADASQQVGWATTNSDGSGVGIVQGFNAAAVGWHLLYLAGVSTVLVALLVGRGIRARNVRVALGVGALLAVAGGAAQVLTYVPHLPSPA